MADVTHRFVIDEPGEMCGRTGGLDTAGEVSRLTNLELSPLHGYHGAVRREI